MGYKCWREIPRSNRETFGENSNGQKVSEPVAAGCRLRVTRFPGFETQGEGCGTARFLWQRALVFLDATPHELSALIEGVAREYGTGRDQGDFVIHG